MINSKKFKKQRFISFTNNKIKWVVTAVMLILCFTFLIVTRSDKMFNQQITVAPTYTPTHTVDAFKSGFCVEQQFTPQSPSMTQISFYYNIVKSNPYANSVHIQILDEDSELVYETSLKLSENNGLTKANINIRSAHLNRGKTYTLKIEEGYNFKEDNMRIPLFKGECAENGKTVINGLSMGENTLKMGYRYNYFSTFSYILCWFLCAAGCLMLAVNLRIPAKAWFFYNLVLIIGVPIVTFALVEYLNYGNITGLSFTHFMMNLLLYYIVYLILFALFNSLRTSLIVGSILFYICGLINYFTITFRGTTVLPSDLLAASTALKVFEKYEFSLSLRLILSFLILICLVQVAARANLRLPKRKMRLIYSGTAAAYCVVVICLFMNTSFLDFVGLTPYQWKQTSACQQRGFIANFTSNIPSLIVKKPSGYDINKLSDTASGANGEFDGFNVKDTVIETLAAPDGKQPNVIAIMNESFSDLSILGDLNTNEDPLSFWHSLDDNVIKGHVVVPVFGAGTSNSEFEFLTGNSVSFLPFGCVPYQQFVHDGASSLTSTLSGQGYTSYAIHPYSPYGWARDKVYNYFGFEAFYSQNAFTNPHKERWYISDESNYNMLINLYENKPYGKPLFLFNVTMQNHGGYNFSPFTPDITIQGYENSYPDVNQYLSMINASDEAFEYLVNYFKNVDEPTIICMFGDHLPKIDTNFYAELMGDTLADGEEVADSRLTHKTPFIIWANYDLGIGSKYADFEDISVSYLSSLLLQAAHLEMPEYNQYLLKLMQCVPIINSTGCFDANGNEIKPDDAQSAYYKMINGYQQLQYNSVIDYDHRDDEVFLPGKSSN